MKKKYTAALLAGILALSLSVSGHGVPASAASGNTAAPEKESDAGDTETSDHAEADDAPQYDLYGNLIDDGSGEGDPELLADAAAEGTVSAHEVSYEREPGEQGLLEETGNGQLTEPDLSGNGSGTAASRRIRRAAASPLPSSYMTSFADLPAVQNQGSYNLCWAYATVDAVRIARQRLGYIDADTDNYAAPFEAYAVFYAGEDHRAFLSSGGTVNPWYNQGGGIEFMAGTMLSWHGPVYASDSPMDESAAYTEEELEQCVTHVTGYRLLNALYSYDRDSDEWQQMLAALKTLIRDCGAVAFNYRAAAPDDNNAVYNTVKGADHVNTLIGWDDEKVTGADRPGAFLFRNTWGSGWGDHGYAWISYYDTSIASAAAYETESTPDKEHEDTVLYSYNDSNYHSWLSGSGGTELKYANLFTAEEDVVIDRVGFYVPAGGTTTVEIHTGCPKNRPGSGITAATVTKSSDVFGYFSAELDEPVTLNRGKRFSLVAYTTDKDGNAVPFFEGDTNESNLITSADEGESFLSLDGSAFTDVQKMASYSYLDNACLRAFGVPAAEGTPTPSSTVPLTPTGTPAPTETPAPAWLRYDEIDLDGKENRK